MNSMARCIILVFANRDCTGINMTTCPSEAGSLLIIAPFVLWVCVFIYNREVFFLLPC
jgi:hypothetical protein